MKKFFYSLVMMAISMMALVSCSSDDDEKVASKDMIGGVVCEFSQDELDIYDIKMTATGPNGVSYGSFNLNTITPKEIDKDGVKKFEIEFMIKEFPVAIGIEASCSKKLSDLQADKKYVLIHSLIAGAYKEKGEGYSKLSAALNRSHASQSGEGMGHKMDSGLPFYEDYIKSIKLLSTTVTR